MPENEKDLPTTTGAASGSTTPDSFASLEINPDDPSGPWRLRTSQAYLFEDLLESVETWPRSGSMRTGMLYERPTSARPIDELESSSWLTPNQTPGATSNNGSNAGRPATGKSLTKQADGRWPTPQAYAAPEGMNKPTWSPLDTAVRGDQNWPTPQTTDANSAARHTTSTGVMHPGTSLTDAIRKDWPSPIAEDAESRTSNGTLLDSVRHWPTPRSAEGGTDFARATREGSGGDDLLTTINKLERRDWLTPAASDQNGLRELDGKRSGGLNTQAADWLTPQARDHKGISQKPATGEFTGSICDQLLEMQGSGPPDPANPSATGSRPVVLNPAWVAALMGFPVDWLDGVAPPSRPSGTRSSRKSPKSSPEKSEPSSKGSE